MFMKRHNYKTLSVFVPEATAKALVAHGKINQVYVNGYEALVDMIDKAITPPELIIASPTDTFWAYHLGHLDSDALIEYYENLYCKEGGKYYGKPESFEGFICELLYRPYFITRCTMIQSMTYTGDSFCGQKVFAIRTTCFMRH